MRNLVHVESDRGTKKRVDDIRVIVELLVDHECKDTHLCSTAVVQFNCSFGRLLIFIPSLLLHFGNASSLNLGLCVVGESKINGTDEDNQLAKTLLRNCVLTEETSETIVNGGKWGAECNISWEMDASCGGKMAEDGKHRDTAMLGLNVSQTIESLLVSILEEVEGIPETKRGLCTKGTLIGHLEGIASHDGR